MGAYVNFAELELHEREGKDYLVLYRRAAPEFAIMAPHGGGIELGTASIADTIAGVEHTFYAFKGIKRSGNRMLHLTSNLFDEPHGVQISNHALIVIAVHGCRDTRDVVFLGGKNEPLKDQMTAALRGSGFAAENSQRPGLRGIDPENICNRCQGGAGVQLELSRGLRERMFDHLAHRSSRMKTETFYRFVDTLRNALGPKHP